MLETSTTSPLAKLLYLRSLSREEQEELYEKKYLPRQRATLKDELERRLEDEHDATRPDTIEPGEYDGYPVAFVRGSDVEIDEITWFKTPDYSPFFARRELMLTRLRSDRRLLRALKLYYRDNVADFITDWGMTYDPRSVNSDQPAFVPFVLFKRQREWVGWLIERWRAEERGLCEKSRESGVTWLAVAAAVSLCLFVDGIAIGFGSRKAELVDTLGNPDSIFEKIRMFVEALPVEFRGSWNRYKHGMTKRVTFPDVHSIISGEGGDEIGRGGRQSLYFVDEAASLERPALIEASLSQTTRCRIDISTPKGLGNPFEQLRHRLPARQVFTLHWTDDPRKDQAWYEKQKAEAFSPVVVAQELDIDYAASVEGVLIPYPWVLASFDAAEKLGIEPTGEWGGGFDIADRGQDLLAFAVRHGISVEWLEEWSGKGSEEDMFASGERAFRVADHFDLDGFRYDADGMGAGFRGIARKINELRVSLAQRQHYVLEFQGSTKVHLPDAQDVRGRKNKDFFENRKAQAWWALRERFRKTFVWLTPNEHGQVSPCSPDDVISLSTRIPTDLRLKLASELSQPTFDVNHAGKIVIDKAPEGTRSPNLADAVMIAFARGSGEVRVTRVHVQRATFQMPGVSAPASAGDGPRKFVVGSGLYVNSSVLNRARAPGAWTNRGL